MTNPNKQKRSKNDGKKKKRSGAGGNKPSRHVPTNCSWVCPGDGIMLRLPDGAGSRSIPMEVVTRGTIGPDAHGNAAMILSPALLHKALNLTPTIQAGKVTDWGPGTDVGPYGSISSNIAQYRVVSASLELHYIGSNLHNAGALSIKAFQATSSVIGPGAVPLDVPTSYTSAASPSYYGRASRGAFVVAARNDSVSLLRYTTPSANDVLTSRALKQYAVFISGADGLNPQAWEYVLRQNVELVPDANNWLARTAMPPPKRDSTMMDRISDAYTTIANASGGICEVADKAATVAKVVASLRGANAYSGNRNAMLMS